MKLLVCCLVLVVCLAVPAVAQTTWYVDPGESIQAAINGAAIGDTVHVNAGTYQEILTINKQLILEGDSKETTIIKGYRRPMNQDEYDAWTSLKNNSIITIGASNVEVRNLGLEEGKFIENTGISNYLNLHDLNLGWGSSQSPIFLCMSDHSNISNVTADRDTRQVWYDPPGTTPGSLFNSTQGGEIAVIWFSSDLTASGNTSDNANMPFYLSMVTDSTFSGNNLSVGAGEAADWEGVGFWAGVVDNCTFDGNTFYNAPGTRSMYLHTTPGNNTIQNNDFSAGGKVVDEDNNTFTGNTWGANGYSAIGHTSNSSVELNMYDASGGDANITITEFDLGTDPGGGQGWWQPGVGEDTSGMEGNPTPAGDVVDFDTDWASFNYALASMGYDVSAVGAEYESTIRPYWWDAGASLWRLPNEVGYPGGFRTDFTFVPKDVAGLLLGDFGIDMDNDRVWAYTDHLSDWQPAGDVPEPGTIALFALGLVGLGAKLRKRKDS